MVMAESPALPTNRLLLPRWHRLKLSWMVIGPTLFFGFFATTFSPGWRLASQCFLGLLAAIGLSLTTRAGFEARGNSLRMLVRTVRFDGVSPSVDIRVADRPSKRLGDIQSVCSVTFNDGKARSVRVIGRPTFSTSQFGSLETWVADATAYFERHGYAVIKHAAW